MLAPRPSLISALAALLASTRATVPNWGNISLFSGAACEPDSAFAVYSYFRHSWCSEAQPIGLDQPKGVFRSYILYDRPQCDDGSRPVFAVYSDPSCADLIASYAPDTTELHIEGNCTTPGGVYQSLEFICGGLNGSMETMPPQGTAVTQQTTSQSTSSSSSYTAATWIPSQATNILTATDVIPPAPTASSGAGVTMMAPVGVLATIGGLVPIIIVGF